MKRMSRMLIQYLSRNKNGYAIVLASVVLIGFGGNAMLYYLNQSFHFSELTIFFFLTLIVVIIMSCANWIMSKMLLVKLNDINEKYGLNNEKVRIQYNGRFYDFYGGETAWYFDPSYHPVIIIYKDEVVIFTWDRMICAKKSNIRLKFIDFEYFEFSEKAESDDFIYLFNSWYNVKNDWIGSNSTDFLLTKILNVPVVYNRDDGPFLLEWFHNKH